jgi:hypothetical protein
MRDRLERAKCTLFVSLIETFDKVAVRVLNVLEALQNVCDSGHQSTSFRGLDLICKHMQNGTKYYIVIPQFRVLDFTDLAT